MMLGTAVGTIEVQIDVQSYEVDITHPTPARVFMEIPVHAAITMKGLISATGVDGKCDSKIPTFLTLLKPHSHNDPAIY
jgi:hypothetical protein